MKRTRWTTILVVALLLPFIGTSLSAQSTKSVTERSNRAVERWNNDVKLDDSQKQAVRVLATGFANQCDSINTLDSITFETRVALRKEAHAHYINAVESLLTTTQRQALKNKQAARKKAQESKRKNNIKK
jgi:hypothetical protein